jgi:hypothetical protein
MCDLEEGDWPEYVLHLERARAKAADAAPRPPTEFLVSEAPVAAEA